MIHRTELWFTELLKTNKAINIYYQTSIRVIIKPRMIHKTTYRMIHRTNKTNNDSSNDSPIQTLEIRRKTHRIIRSQKTQPRWSALREDWRYSKAATRSTTHSFLSPSTSRFRFSMSLFRATIMHRCASKHVCAVANCSSNLYTIFPGRFCSEYPTNFSQFSSFLSVCTSTLSTLRVLFSMQISTSSCRLNTKRTTASFMLPRIISSSENCDRPIARYIVAFSFAAAPPDRTTLHDKYLKITPIFGIRTDWRAWFRLVGRRESTARSPLSAAPGRFRTRPLRFQRQTTPSLRRKWGSPRRKRSVPRLEPATAGFHRRAKTRRGDASSAAKWRVACAPRRRKTHGGADKCEAEAKTLPATAPNCRIAALRNDKDTEPKRNSCLWSFPLEEAPLSTNNRGDRAIHFRESRGNRRLAWRRRLFRWFHRFGRTRWGKNKWVRRCW